MSTRYLKSSGIGDISITLSGYDSNEEFVVEVRAGTNTLEVLEYSNFTDANNEYNMLRSLLQKVAAYTQWEGTQT